MQTITAVIPAKNEEANIERCIQSVAWCDRIVVMWMGDDETGEIAKRLGAEVIEQNKSDRADYASVQQNINWAIDHCTTDWMLRIDADEAVTPELKEEICSNVLTLERSNVETSIVAYGIPRAQFFWKGFLRGGDWAYDRLVRLFRPKYARYDPIVAIHEQFKVTGKVGYLHNRLLHYSHPTLAVARAKFQTYTDREVGDMTESAPRAMFNLIFQPPYVFLRWMIWHQGWKDGCLGVVAGAYRAWYEWLKYSKYLKVKNQRSKVKTAT